MTSPDINNSKCEAKAIDRKKFLLATGAAAGAATLFGSAPKAYATDTNFAYWDAVQTFSADQHFGNITAGMSTSTGQVYFGSGQPWVDVKAYPFNAKGDGVTDDTQAIQNAINAAVYVSPSLGESTFNNPIIFFPPGDYLLNSRTNSTIIIPNNGSNFCLMGAGYNSSRLVWGPLAPASTPTSPQAMLLLNNAFQVHIKDMGFIGRAGTNMPQYGIHVYRGDGASGGGPSLLLLERVFIGSSAGTASVIDTAICFNAYSYADFGNNDQATFRDVSIQYVNTGYHFGMENALIHTITGGSVQNCSTIAIDNTPIPYAVNIPGDPLSTLGGSYTVFGTRFAGNALTFQIAQIPLGDNIDIIGIHAGTAANPENALLASSAIAGPPPVSFIGGSALLNAPGAVPTISFNSTLWPLEFHGFRLYASTGATMNFPGTGAVNFYGGKLYTKSCQYNGPLHFHGTIETNAAPVFTPMSGSTTAALFQLGYRDHLVGTNANTVTFASGSALGGTGTVSGTGTNLGGTITVKIPAGDGPTSGVLATITFSYYWFPSTAQVMFTAANTAAAGVMNLISASTIINTPPAQNNQIDVNVSAPGLPVPATGTTTFIWNYLVLT